MCGYRTQSVVSAYNTQTYIHTVGQNQHEINFICETHSIPISFLLSVNFAKWTDNNAVNRK